MISLIMAVALTILPTTFKVDVELETVNDYGFAIIIDSVDSKHPYFQYKMVPVDAGGIYEIRRDELPVGKYRVSACLVRWDPIAMQQDTVSCVVELIEER